MRLVGVGTAVGVLALIAAAIGSAMPPYALPAALSVRVSGAGTIVGPGISCPRNCVERFGTPTMLTLRPRSAGGHYFIGWGGACWGERPCRVTMNGSQAVDARFIALPNTEIKSDRLSQNSLTLRLGGSGGAGRLSFTCRLDHGRSRPCVSPVTYNGLPAGKHSVTVQALDGNSRRDPTPAQLRFRSP